MVGCVCVYVGVCSFLSFFLKYSLLFLFFPLSSLPQFFFFFPFFFPSHFFTSTLVAYASRGVGMATGVREEGREARGRRHNDSVGLGEEGENNSNNNSNRAAAAVLGPLPSLPSLFSNATTCSGRTQQQRRTAARHVHGADGHGPDRGVPQADPADPPASTHCAAHTRRCTWSM
jgi:hypothetical protein